MECRWPLESIASVCSSIDYGLTASSSIAPTDCQFLRITDIVGGSVDWSTVPFVLASPEQQRKYRLNEGDIVVARTGASTGAVGYIRSDPRAVFASYLVRLKISEVADSRYIYYALYSDYFKSYINGILGEKSAQPNASARTMTQARIPIPPIDEQRAIAHILGTLDDKIELNRQMNQTLDDIARTLFRSWFIDFDPVRARAEGRQPEGMDAETAALFPDRFVDSELGPIPEGWEVKPIGELVTVVGGSTPSTKEPEFWDGGTHLWVTPKDLSGLASPILIDTARRITDAGVRQISSRLLPAGSVLLSSRAPVGYLAITTEPTAINQGFIGMICNRGVPNSFVLNWARERMDVIKGNAGGTTFAEISKTAFRPIKGVTPILAILDAFDRKTSGLYRLIESNLRESVTLEQLRDVLLPELTSGRISMHFEDAVAGIDASL